MGCGLRTKLCVPDTPASRVVGLGCLLLVFLAVFCPGEFGACRSHQSDASGGRAPVKLSEYSKAAMQRSLCFALLLVCCLLVRLPERRLIKGNLLSEYEHYHLVHLGWQVLIRG